MQLCGFFTDLGPDRVSSFGVRFRASGIESRSRRERSGRSILNDQGNEGHPRCPFRSVIAMAYVLHQLLTESAARCPDAEAVRLLNDAITYRELETRSNQLAHALIKSGVTPSDQIGIYLQKSPAAIVSIFGVLKTGACYVPVDANAPGPRLLEIARQCEFRALITSCTLSEKLRSTSTEEWPMSVIFFVDKLPDVATFASQAFSFADALPSQSVTP